MRYYDNTLINSLETKNLTTDEIESRRNRMDFFSVMVIINGGDDEDYFVMMNAAIYGINKGLTDEQILNYIDAHFTYSQMRALADLMRSGVSDDMIKILKKRTHTYNALQYDYIPHIDDVEEIRLAQQREKRRNIQHMNLNDLTEMNNRRGFCSHYYFINGIPVSFIEQNTSGGMRCKICNGGISNSIMRRLNEAIDSFDTSDECTVPNTRHVTGYNYTKLKRLGIIP